MDYFKNSPLPTPFLNFINESKHTIFILIDKELNILDYNKCFSKLLGLQNKNLKTLDKYFTLNNEITITLEKLLDNAQFKLFTKKEIPLSFRCSKCELYKSEEHYIIIGEVEFHYDLNVIEKMSQITSELTASTMELNKKNCLLDQAITKIEEQHNMIVSQSRFIAIQELTLMLAHQWRQPLSVINMYNNLLKMEISAKKPSIENFNKYVDESEKMILQLSETINLFTKHFENQQIQEISINKILKDTIILFRPNLKSANVTLTKELNSQVTINIQPSTFVQICTIILQNSFDAFTKNNIEDRTIHISSYDEDQYVVIEFLDNAGGINENIITKVFDPYFSTKLDKNGTGLGLYTAYILTCEILHGITNIENKNDGAMVQIKLPKKL